LALRAPLTRGAATSLAVGAACLAAWGCGKGARSTTTTAASTARTSKAQPQTGSPTAAQEAAFASAVNLTAADVPGFKASPSSQHAETSDERRLQRDLAACIGAHAPAAGESAGPSPSERHSPEFTRRVSLITFTTSSSISFSSSAQSAARELATLRSRRTRACLQRYVQALLRSRHLGGVTFRHVTITQGTPPAPGTSGGFGWRVTAHASLKGISVPVYLDVLGFVYRTAEVRLLSTGLIAPFPSHAQEHLYRTLIARARAQSL
jgi:hypothetical protein